ncbi:hypothetical protein [Curtobacterium flaccumfaciens]|uniref:hypothetical protein n=1 Tax=Curtobacterium flaccumfaciens TaxID=2035 RepID=UPI001ADB65DE|nr:hypothetical protein [Curtobacterium flaccumfaciens]MBO9043450.1 hypothetical protein [Curtobacterium flaccumfaciens pv. flaccumfaciens]
MSTINVPSVDVQRGSLVYFGAHHEELLGYAWIVTRVEEREPGERWALAKGTWHQLPTSVFIEKPESVGYTTVEPGLMECDECASLVKSGHRDHHSAWHWYVLQP